MNTGRADASAAKSALGGAFISNTIMVMMTAITPSVMASSRPLCITDLSRNGRHSAGRNSAKRQSLGVVDVFLPACQSYQNVSRETIWYDRRAESYHA